MPVEFYSSIFLQIADHWMDQGAVFFGGKTPFGADCRAILRMARSIGCRSPGSSSFATGNANRSLSSPISSRVPMRLRISRASNRTSAFVIAQRFADSFQDHGGRSRTCKESAEDPPCLVGSSRSGQFPPRLDGIPVCHGIGGLAEQFRGVLVVGVGFRQPPIKDSRKGRIPVQRANDFRISIGNTKVS